MIFFGFFLFFGAEISANWQGNTVGRETLLSLGFKSVGQCSLNAMNSAKPESTNRQVRTLLLCFTLVR
jgi:hypothetical protein